MIDTHRLFRAAAMLGICVLAVGCADHVDLVGTPWTSLEIEYCTSRGETKIWRSTQAGELEELRALMAPAPHQGLTMLLKSYTNEIRLALASGQRWNLYYRTTPTDVTFHDPDSIKRSFVVKVPGAFYARLSSALIAAGGEPISLKGGCRIPSMAGT
ncbi:MAG: hypothetical protein ACREJE_06570 [Candidatus Rokuibacteriota bacterium]